MQGWQYKKKHDNWPIWPAVITIKRIPKQLTRPLLQDWHERPGRLQPQCNKSVRRRLMSSAAPYVRRSLPFSSPLLAYHVYFHFVAQSENIQENIQVPAIIITKLCSRVCCCICFMSVSVTLLSKPETVDVISCSQNSIAFDSSYPKKHPIVSICLRCGGSFNKSIQIISDYHCWVCQWKNFVVIARSSKYNTNAVISQWTLVVYSLNVDKKQFVCHQLKPLSTLHTF